MIIEYNEEEEKLGLWEFTIYDKEEAGRVYRFLIENKIRFSFEEA